MDIQDTPAPHRRLDWLVIALALAISLAVIWWVTETPLAPIAFAAGIVMLGLIAWFTLKPRDEAGDVVFAAPDWSVTVAAIEQPDEAIAITDRANRLTCANGRYREWIGPTVAPLSLKLSQEGMVLIDKTSRDAWRDGFADCSLEFSDRRWSIVAERAGRADDHIIWRFRPEMPVDASEQLGAFISGELGSMLSASGVESALVDPEGTLRSVSPGFAERGAGDDKATLAGQEFVRFLRTDDADRIYFAREGKQGTPQTLVQVPLAPAEADNEAIAAAPSLMLLVDSGVGLGGGWGAEAQAGTEQLRGLLEQLPLGLAMTDRDGHLLFANPAFRRASGIAEKRLPPYPSDVVVREDKAAFADAVRRFGKGPASVGDIAVRLRSNPDEPVQLGLAGIRGLGEAAVLLSMADSTEETRLKRQVAQATKMQAVGQLAGGVAHDFNNVLTAILGTCDLMLLRHTPGDSDYDDIQQIRANSNRAASLTRQLLAFSRQQTLQPIVLQLPDVIAEVSQLMKRLLGEKITLTVRHDRDLGAIRADPQQLEQVIINLAVNARDAMQALGEKGQLRMTSRRVAASDIRRMDSEIIPVGDYTALIVEDTGGGIPEDVLTKIFEPFFTTKPQGKGTGLGLSTVYGIVKQSGGFIFAENLPGENGSASGARFTLYFPVHRGEPEAKAPAKPAEPKASFSGGGKVLLVEDEDMVRAVAERALAREGYDVTTASDGEDGLVAIANGGEFDIVVSDVVMPSMDGPAMVKAIRKLKPDLPVLFMSGYAESQLREEIDVSRMHFIAKPFSVKQISDKVAEVLGAGG